MQDAGSKPIALALEVLRQGSRGPDTQRLQRLLNLRLAPSPGLRLDGLFGPITHQAVLQYQGGVRLTVDGVVGKQTWYRLLRGDKAVLPARAARSATAPVKAPVAVPKAQPKAVAPLAAVQVGPPLAAAPPPSVWLWPLEDKFAEALRRTVPRLPASMQHEFQALLSPANLAILVATLVVWAGSHAFGVGEVVDLILLIGGVVFLGMAVFDVAAELGNFLTVTSSASDDKDLDKAASHLARAVAIVGVAAFIALIAKFAKATGGKSRKSGAADTQAGSNKGSAKPNKSAQSGAETKTTASTPKPAPRSPAKLGESMGKHARPAEQATAKRLAETDPRFDGRRFEAPPPPDPGHDWVDDLGRTYDAMGDGSKSKHFKLDQFTKSIDSHLLKGNDFTVIDMTGYSAEQIAAVQRYADSLSAVQQASIIRVGF